MPLKNFLLDLFFPLNCLGCGAPGVRLCEKCFRRLKFTDKKYDLKTPALDKLFIAGDYDEPLLAELIKKFKFQPLADLGEPLARFLSLFWTGASFALDGLNASNQTEPILVIPIPLPRRRERWRGFNQAEKLARPLAEHFDYELNRNLKRQTHSAPQSSLGERERAQNIKDVFAWRGLSLKNRSVILIDDVATTGATLNEAGQILREAGAAQVYGLVLAKG